MKIQIRGQTHHVWRHPDFIARQGWNRRLLDAGFRCFHHFLSDRRRRDCGSLGHGARGQCHGEQCAACDFRNDHDEFPQRHAARKPFAISCARPTRVSGMCPGGLSRERRPKTRLRQPGHILNYGSSTAPRGQQAPPSRADKFTKYSFAPSRACSNPVIVIDSPLSASSSAFPKEHQKACLPDSVPVHVIIRNRVFHPSTSSNPPPLTLTGF